MNSDLGIWKDIEERFKFFLMLTALCACGYLAWHQFIYIVFMLIFGGIAASMTPLYNYSRSRLLDLQGLDESDLKAAIKQIVYAKKIIEKYCFDNDLDPAILSDVNQALNVEKDQAERTYVERRQERVEQERIEGERIRQRGVFHKAGS